MSFPCHTRWMRSTPFEAPIDLARPGNGMPLVGQVGVRSEGVQG